MRPIAQCNVAFNFARDVTHVSVFAKLALVSIRRRVEQHNFSVFGNYRSVDGHVSCRRPREALYGGREPKKLFERIRNPIRLSREKAALVGVAGEVFGGTAEQSGRRVVTAGHHGKCETKNIDQRNRLTVEFRMDQGRNHVFSRILANDFDASGEVRHQFSDGFSGAREIAFRIAGDDGVGPAIECTSVSFRNAKRVAHHKARQRLEELSDNVALVHFAKACDALLHERSQQGLDRLDLLGRKTFDGKLAQGRVIGRVHHDDRWIHAKLFHLANRHGESLRRRKRRGIDGSLEDILESRQRPGFVPAMLKLVNRVVVSQGLVHRKGVAPCFSTPGLEARLGR